jgi:hypothetical protein
MMSGNGAQLWFALPPIVLDDENRETVQANLKAFEAELREQIASDRIKVDSIHDLARIIKVVGTVSRKGEPTAERPHRVSVALDGLERTEDLELRARLLRPPPAGARQTAIVTGRGEGALVLHEARHRTVQFELIAVDLEFDRVRDSFSENLPGTPFTILLALREVNHGFLGATQVERGATPVHGLANGADVGVSVLVEELQE